MLCGIILVQCQRSCEYLRYQVKSKRLKEIRRQAGDKLQNQLETDVLICHALQQERTFLYAHSEDELTESQIDSIYHLIKRRQLGEPVAYLLGFKEFYGRSFKVNAAVLIPRSETETIIDQARDLRLPHAAKVLDLGTGSGCIGLTLAADHPSWIVCASDVSEQALAVCIDNRQTLNLTNVVTHLGSLFEPWRGQTFDLIVANLPYIADNDPHLDEGDLRYEPKTALIADGAGRALIQQAIAEAPQYLKVGGYLLMEHGYDQQTSCTEALQTAGFTNISGLNDLSGHPRLVKARWNEG